MAVPGTCAVAPRRSGRQERHGRLEGPVSYDPKRAYEPWHRSCRHDRCHTSWTCSPPVAMPWAPANRMATARLAGGPNPWGRAAAQHISAHRPWTTWAASTAASISAPPLPARPGVSPPACHAWTNRGEPLEQAAGGASQKTPDW